MNIHRYLATLLILLFSWHSAFADEELAPLRVANQKSTIKLLLEAAGQLRDVPYRIEWSEFPAAAPLGEALNAGAVDAGGLGDAPYVFALGAGAPLKVVSIILADGRYSTAILVPKNSPLQNVADLKGKRIVTNRGSIGHYLVLRALQEVGLKSSDVTFVNLLPSDARGALDAGNADAWSTWEPYTTIALTQNEARVLRKGNDLLNSHHYFAATEAATIEKREQLKDFVVRIERAYLWANDHPREYAQAQSRVTGLPVEVHLATNSSTHFSRVAIDDSIVSGLQRTADLYLQERVLTRPVSVAQGFDPSFNSSRP